MKHGYKEGTMEEGKIEKELEELTPKEMLLAVNKAIYTITVGGQSYSIGSRSLTRADLSTLMQLKNSLINDIGNEEVDSKALDGTYVGIFDGR